MNATKRALIRTRDHAKSDITDFEESTWQLLDTKAKEVISGSPKWLGVTFGIPLWEIDFSSLRTPGIYQLNVPLRNENSEYVDSLPTLPFEGRNKLRFTRTFFGISIRNDEPRKSLLREGGGLHDCNSTMG